MNVSSVFSVVWLNRVQNESYTCKCVENEKKNWQCTILHEFKQQNGWIIPHKPSHIFNKDGTGMVTIEPQLQNDGKHYNQLILVDCMEGIVVQLTQGKFDVTKILVWDEVSGTFYFMGTKEYYPGSLHMFSVDVGGKRNINCLTCDHKVRYFIQI